MTLRVWLVCGALVACGGGCGIKKDAAAGRDGAAGWGNAGSGGTTGAAGISDAAGAAGTTGAAGATSDGGDAPAGDAPIEVGRETWPPGTFPDYASGTRLRARVYETADGEKLWHGWWDSARGENCDVARAEDGKLRCLPGIQSEVRYYAAPGCSQPLAYGSACLNQLYVASDPMNCGRLTIFKRAAKIAPAMVYSRAGPECGGGSVPAGYDFYATTREPPTSFVAATEVHDPRGALMQRYYELEDGALQPVGAWDPAVDQACEPLGTDIPDRCVPSPMLTQGQSKLVYSDDTCAMPLFELPKNVCGNYFDTTGTVATYDDQAAAPACNGTIDRTFFRLAAEFQGTPFDIFLGTCGHALTGPDFGYFALGAKVLPADMPALKQVDVGAGRVKVRYYASATNDKIHATTLFDSTTGFPCTPTMIGGTLRCLPNAPELSFFADDQCKKAYYSRDKQPNCTLPAPPGWAISWESSLCDSTFVTYSNPHLYAVGAERTNVGALYFAATAQCAPSVADASGLQFFDVTEHSTTELAPLTDVVE